MKTIIHLELSDEDRSDLAKRMHRAPYTKLLATRKEITEFVHEFIQESIRDGREQPDESAEEAEAKNDSAIADRIKDRANRVCGFVPSRGDESYLYAGRSVSIKEACSAVLDATERLDSLIWQELERNRVK